MIDTFQKEFFAQPQEYQDASEPTSAQEAINEAKVFAYAPFVSEMLVGLLNKNVRDKSIGEVTQEATAHMCTYAASREAYWLWKHASNFFQVITILESRLETSYPYRFTAFPESDRNNGVLTLDLHGVWRYSSSANHIGSSDNKSDLLALRQSESLEKILSGLEDAETTSPKTVHLYMTANQITGIWNTYKMSQKPQLSDVDITQFPPAYNYYTGKLFVPLDPHQEGELYDPAKLAMCRVLDVPVLTKINSLYPHTVVPPHVYSRQVIIPK